VHVTTSISIETSYTFCLQLCKSVLKLNLVLQVTIDVSTWNSCWNIINLTYNIYCETFLEVSHLSIKLKVFDEIPSS
jgi:hypothetical protein